METEKSPCCSNHNCSIHQIRQDDDHYGENNRRTSKNDRRSKDNDSSAYNSHRGHNHICCSNHNRCIENYIRKHHTDKRRTVYNQQEEYDVQIQ